MGDLVMGILITGLTIAGLLIVAPGICFWMDYFSEEKQKDPAVEITFNFDGTAASKNYGGVQIRKTETGYLILCDKFGRAIGHQRGCIIRQHIDDGFIAHVDCEFIIDLKNISDEPASNG